MRLRFVRFAERVQSEPPVAGRRRGGPRLNRLHSQLYRISGKTPAWIERFFRLPCDTGAQVPAGVSIHRCCKKMRNTHKFGQGVCRGRDLAQKCCIHIMCRWMKVNIQIFQEVQN